MPNALSCPVCNGALKETIRETIAIDVCTTCRGVWLDRGELEKLLEAERAEFETPEPRPVQKQHQHQSAPPYCPPQAGPYPMPVYDDDDDHYKKRHYHPHKKSTMHKLFDLFD